jgi:phosphinothricin tripeptide acetyl hydrolase
VSHPGVEVIRAFLADSSLDAGTVEEQRAAMAQLASAAQPPSGVTVTTGSLGGVGAEWLVPPGAPADAAVLYLHGGGYCTGSLDSHRDLAARIAVAVGCPVVTLDYGLAPEQPYPAAVTDTTAAYAALLESGLGATRLAIAGDSAGGGLTMAALLALRHAGTPLPSAAVCLSPWVDLTQTAPSFDTMAEWDPMVGRVGLDTMAAAYLGDTDPHTELASPLFAADLGGLPPVLIEVGEHEVLLDDATRLADRLRDAGGSVTLTVWPEMIHVFQAFPGSLIPEVDQSVAAVGAFLARHLGLADAPSSVRP